MGELNNTRLLIFWRSWFFPGVSSGNQVVSELEGWELGVAPEVDPEVDPGRGWFRPGAPNSSLELPAPPGTTQFLSGTPLELLDLGAPGSCLEFLVPPWSCWSQEFQTRTWIPPGAPDSPLELLPPPGSPGFPGIFPSSPFPGSSITCTSASSGCSASSSGGRR